MARPSRNANPERILGFSRTFFVTTKTSMARALLQSERNAMLLIDVLRFYAVTKKFFVHDFVVMPDHVHLLITVNGDTTIEKAVQFIKGGFSYRLRKESGYPGEVWQRGFSEVRVNDAEAYQSIRDYIAQNPVKVGLANARDEFPFCYGFLVRQKAQGLKPSNPPISSGTAEAVP